MDRWNIVATLNYLPHDDEARIVLAKCRRYDHEGGPQADRRTWCVLADLTRHGFIDGDISTVMSPAHGDHLGGEHRDLRRYRLRLPR